MIDLGSYAAPSRKRETRGPARGLYVAARCDHADTCEADDSFGHKAVASGRCAYCIREPLYVKQRWGGDVDRATLAVRTDRLSSILAFAGYRAKLEPRTT